MDNQQIQDMFDRAMRIADHADSLKRQRLLKEAVLSYEEAYNLVMVVLPFVYVEPTRSVYYQTAAALALDAGMSSEAVRLADIGLAGKPDYDTQLNLLDIKETAQASVEDTQDGD